MTNPEFIDGVIVRVRADISDVTRETLGKALARHLGAEDAPAIEDALDRSYGCEAGAYG